MLLAMAVLTAVVLFLYGSVLLHPNDYILTLGFDGIKNYFTTAWHLKYDTTRLGFTGMNHPYGEHVLFTDNQPALVNLTRLFSQFFPRLSDQGVALVNLFQIFSLYLSVFCYYLLFRRLKMPAWLCACIAVMLTLLTPQHHRWAGHFGLSHAWVIPLLLLWLHTYEQKVYRRRISIRIGMLAFFAAQLHMYFFGLFVLFLSAYHLVSFLRAPRAARFYKRIVHWMLMLLLPFAMLTFWIQAEHFASDRPGNPYGFLAYIGKWEGLFLPYPNWPMYQWIDKNITSIRVIDGEALAYVGMVATAFFLFTLFRGFRLFSKHELTEWGGKQSDRHYLRNIWWSSVMLGLFACGFPFAIPGFNWLADSFGPLKQFRSLGRFNWMLFVVFNLAAFYWLWHFAKQQTKPWLKALIIAIPLLALCAETITQQYKRRTWPIPNLLTQADTNSVSLAWLPAIKSEQYQAILSLPYYHLGSENLTFEPNYNQFLHTQRTVYATGLPDMGVHMSRTPLSQTINSAQLVLEPIEMPRILHDMTSTKDLLLFSVAENKWEADQRNPYLFQKAKPIFSNQDALVYQLPIDSVRAMVRSHINAQKTEAENALVQSEVWTKVPESGYFYRNGYDSLHQVPNSMSGKGALLADMKDSTYLFRAALPAGKYQLSYWLDVTKDLNIHASLHTSFTDAQGQILQQQVTQSRSIVKAILDGWALCEVEIEVPANTTQAAIFMSNKGVSSRLRLDEFQLRSSNCNVYYRDEQHLVKNNRWYVD
jgi:hypothetical protein